MISTRHSPPRPKRISKTAFYGEHFCPNGSSPTIVKSVVFDNEEEGKKLQDYLKVRKEVSSQYLTDLVMLSSKSNKGFCTQSHHIQYSFDYRGEILGTLFQKRLVCGKPFSPIEVFRVCRGLLLGLQALFGKDLSHGNIRPEYVLVGSREINSTLEITSVRLLDNLIDTNGSLMQAQRHNYRLGHPLYMSPDTFSRFLFQNNKAFPDDASAWCSDLFAIGLMTLEMGLMKPLASLVCNLKTKNFDRDYLNSCVAKFEEKYRRNSAVFVKLVKELVSIRGSARYDPDFLAQNFSDLNEDNFKRNYPPIFSTNPLQWSRTETTEAILADLRDISPSKSLNIEYSDIRSRSRSPVSVINNSPERAHQTPQKTLRLNSIHSRSVSPYKPLINFDMSPGFERPKTKKQPETLVYYSPYQSPRSTIQSHKPRASSTINARPAENPLPINLNQSQLTQSPPNSRKPLISQTKVVSSLSPIRRRNLPQSDVPKMRETGAKDSQLQNSHSFWRYQQPQNHFISATNNTFQNSSSLRPKAMTPQKKVLTAQPLQPTNTSQNTGSNTSYFKLDYFNTKSSVRNKDPDQVLPNQISTPSTSPTPRRRITTPIQKTTSQMIMYDNKENSSIQPSDSTTVPQIQRFKKDPSKTAAHIFEMPSSVNQSPEKQQGNFQNLQPTIQDPFY